MFLGGGTPSLRRLWPGVYQKISATPEYAQTVWTRVKKFGVTTHVGVTCFYSSHAPLPRRPNTAVTHSFGTSYMRATSSNNQILHSDQLHMRKIFSTVDHRCWREICMRYLNFLFTVFIVSTCVSVTLLL